MKSEFATNDAFSKKLQPIAITEFYLSRPELWPGHRVIEVDTEFHTNPIARALDIGGTDKLLIGNNGYLVHLGQRFRREEAWYKHCDLTIRDSEFERHMDALNNGGTIPDCYSYGFSNQAENDFIAFFVIHYRAMLRDIQDGQFNLCLFERRQKWQHNFYRDDWRWLPERYIRFRFVQASYQPLLPGLSEMLCPDPTQS